MAHLISVIEIPLLVDLICGSLEPSDHQRCLYVSKTWYDAFQSHAWRSLYLKPAPFMTFLRLSPTQEDKILQHARWVHTLETALTPGATFLEKASWPQLRHLHLHGRNDRTLLADPRSTQNMISMIKTAIQLLKGCPRLETLIIVDIPASDRFQMTDSLRAVLPSLTSLTSLTLTKVKLESFTPTLMLLNKSCPKSLLHLDLLFVPGNRYSTRASPPPCGYPPSGRMLSLRQFRLAVGDSNKDRFPSASLCRFLQHCPDLDDLSLPIVDEDENAVGAIVSTVIQYTTKIQRLELRDESGKWIEHTRRLLAACPGLKAFSFRQYGGDISILQSLLQHSESTLEVLVIQDQYFTNPEEIFLILSGFPRLKTLTIPSNIFKNYMCLEEAAGSTNLDQFRIQDLLQGPSPADHELFSASSVLSATHGSSHHNSSSGLWKWACQDLESLTLPIHFPDLEEMRFERPDLSFTDMDKEWSMLVVQFLSQLCSLPKLKHVNLDWFWFCYDKESRKPSDCVLELIDLVRAKDAALAERLGMDLVDRKKLDWTEIDDLYRIRRRELAVEEGWTDEDGED